MKAYNADPWILYKRSGGPSHIGCASRRVVLVHMSGILEMKSVVAHRIDVPYAGLRDAKTVDLTFSHVLGNGAYRHVERVRCDNWISLVREKSDC